MTYAFTYRKTVPEAVKQGEKTLGSTLNNALALAASVGVRDGSELDMILRAHSTGRRYSAAITPENEDFVVEIMQRYHLKYSEVLHCMIEHLLLQEWREYAEKKQKR